MAEATSVNTLAVLAMLGGYRSTRTHGAKDVIDMALPLERFPNALNLFGIHTGAGF